LEYDDNIYKEKQIEKPVRKRRKAVDNEKVGKDSKIKTKKKKKRFYN